MKLLIDTNIVLDVLLKREPFYQNAVKVMNLAQHEDIHEYVSASAVTDIYYIADKQIKDRKSKMLWKQAGETLRMQYNILLPR